MKLKRRFIARTWNASVAFKKCKQREKEKIELSENRKNKYFCTAGEIVSSFSVHQVTWYVLNVLQGTLNCKTRLVSTKWSEVEARNMTNRKENGETFHNVISQSHSDDDLARTDSNSNINDCNLLLNNKRNLETSIFDDSSLATVRKFLDYY